MKGNDGRMLAKAQRLIEKYAQPNPPRMGPSPKFNEGILEVWIWAEAADRTDILSGLAQTACRMLRSSEDKKSMQSKLHKLAEQAKAEQRWKEYADFLLALSELEDDEVRRLALYEETLDIYTRLDDWAGEAVCASLAAAIYRHWRRFDEARGLYLRSCTLWVKAKHRKGIGDSLIHLADLLEIEGRYVEACRLVYRAKKLLAHSMWTISARDILRNISHGHKVSPHQYETQQTVEELISESFGVIL